MGNAGQTFAFAVIAVLAASCGGPRAVAPTEPAPAPAEAAPTATTELSGDDCVALLQEGFAKATALRDAPYTPENSKQVIAGETVALRGSRDHTLCIASRVTSWCEHARDERGTCLEAEATENVYAVGVVANATREVTEMNTFLGGYSGNESWDLLSWEVVAIGPDRDAIVFRSRSESGDSDVDRIIWLAFDGAHLSELLSYYRGYDNGRGGRVEAHVTDRPSEGFFAIELAVCIGSWDACEDESEGPGDDGDESGGEEGGDEMEAVLNGTDVCSFDASSRRYRCQPDLARQLAQRLRR